LRSDFNQFYHTSAIVGAAVETLTLPVRRRPTGGPNLSTPWWNLGDYCAYLSAVPGRARQHNLFQLSFAIPLIANENGPFHSLSIDSNAAIEQSLLAEHCVVRGLSVDSSAQQLFASKRLPTECQQLHSAEFSGNPFPAVSPFPQIISSTSSTTAVAESEDSIEWLTAVPMAVQLTNGSGTVDSYVPQLCQSLAGVRSQHLWDYPSIDHDGWREINEQLVELYTSLAE
jgi:hypothetical protein